MQRNTAFNLHWSYSQSVSLDDPEFLYYNTGRNFFFSYSVYTSSNCINYCQAQWSHLFSCLAKELRSLREGDLLQWKIQLLFQNFVRCGISFLWYLVGQDMWCRIMSVCLDALFLLTINNILYKGRCFALYIWSKCSLHPVCRDVAKKLQKSQTSDKINLIHFILLLEH